MRISPDPAPTPLTMARPAFHGMPAADQNVSVPKSSRRRTRLRIEGLRGAATRQAVILRYCVYWMGVMSSAAIVAGAFKGISGAESGGMWLLLSATYQIAVAAIGAVFLAPQRPEIVEQLRAYLFGYTVLPSLGVAAFLWLAQRMASSATGEDVFLGTMVNALPFLYFLPVIIPAIIFTKLVAGFRVVSRVSMDDEETMRIYTRNDGYQR